MPFCLLRSCGKAGLRGMTVIVDLVLGRNRWVWMVEGRTRWRRRRLEGVMREEEENVNGLYRSYISHIDVLDHTRVSRHI